MVPTPQVARARGAADANVETRCESKENEMKLTGTAKASMAGLLNVAAVFVAAAVTASGATGALAATRSDAAIHRCGVVAAGGASWQVSSSSTVSCTYARAIVRKLGARPTPSVRLPYYSGVYRGMRCLGANKNGHRLIDCGGTGGRAVIAVARA